MTFEDKLAEFTVDNKRKMWFLVYGFIALVWMPVGNYIVFKHGWSNNIMSWPIVIIEPILALAWAFLAGLDFWNVSRKVQAVRVALTYFVVFMLSSTVIIYGWGMRPQSWPVIILFYAVACCLPPFDQISYDLIWWRKEKDDTEIDLLRQERAHLRSAINSMEASAEMQSVEEEQDSLCDYRAAMTKANAIRDKLANLQ